jgi:6-phosphogluconolactonase
VTGREGPWGEPSIEVLKDPEAVAETAARRLVEALLDAAARRGRADWVTTGGSTPVLIYRHLVRSPLRDRVPWNRVHVWWTDDRFAARGDELSNRKPFDEVILGPGGVPLPPENVHGMPIDEALEYGESAHSVAAGYEADLLAAPLERDASVVPIFDVVLAGVGPDGHVFSIFPGSALFDEPAWVSAVPAPSHVEPHVARISLSPRILGAAWLPLIVVVGEAKAPILAAIFGPERDVRRWPAQLARRPGALWLLDRAAAGGLPAGVRA